MAEASTLSRLPAVPPDGGERLLVGPFELRPAEWGVRAGGRHVALTRREFQVFYVLARRAGHVVERAQLQQAVWGHQRSEPPDRSVDAYVVKLRRKLAAAAPGWSCIHTHVGIGYRFEPEPVRPSTARGRRTS